MIGISGKVIDAANAVSTAFASASQTGPSSITIGQSAVTSTDDGQNANLLIAQPAALAQAGTVQSMSFYVTVAAGKLRLGLYDATGSGGGPGKKIAETAEITPVAGWNTANVTAQVALAIGTYWLAYLPSSNSLGFRKNPLISTSRLVQFAYGVMPATFPPTGQGPASQFSIYATLSVSGSQQVPQFTISLSTSAVSGAPDGTTSGAGTFPGNSVVTIAATPASGLGFVNWSDAQGNVLSTSQVYTFTLVENMATQAFFTKLGIATNPGGTFQAADLVRSITSHASGNWYFEITVNAAANTAQVGVGIDNNAESLTVEAGRAGAIAWLGDGTVNYNGTVAAYRTAPFSVGDVLGIDANISAKTISFRVNGNAFSQNFSIAAIATGSPLFALAQLTNINDQVTANFTGVSPAFAFSAPATAWG